MTDKIIIDGVDVSGCKHYKNQNCIADYVLTDMEFSEAKCSKNPNCYYKQLKREQGRAIQSHKDCIHNLVLLKRKTEECEKLKERTEGLIEDCNSCNFHKYKQALKEIKYYITDLFHGAKDSDRPYYEIILQKCEVLNG